MVVPPTSITACLEDTLPNYFETPQFNNTPSSFVRFMRVLAHWLAKHFESFDLLVRAGAVIDNKHRRVVYSIAHAYALYHELLPEGTPENPYPETNELLLQKTNDLGVAIGILNEEQSQNFKVNPHSIEVSTRALAREIADYFVDRQTGDRWLAEANTNGITFLKNLYAYLPEQANEAQQIISDFLEALWRNGFTTLNVNDLNTVVTAVHELTQMLPVECRMSQAQLGRRLVEIVVDQNENLESTIKTQITMQRAEDDLDLIVKIITSLINNRDMKSIRQKINSHHANGKALAVADPKPPLKRDPHKDRDGRNSFRPEDGRSGSGSRLERSSSNGNERFNDARGFRRSYSRPGPHARAQLREQQDHADISENAREAQMRSSYKQPNGRSLHVFEDDSNGSKIEDKTDAKTQRAFDNIFSGNPVDCVDGLTHLLVSEADENPSIALSAMSGPVIISDRTSGRSTPSDLPSLVKESSDSSCASSDEDEKETEKAAAPRSVTHKSYKPLTSEENEKANELLREAGLSHYVGSDATQRAQALAEVAAQMKTMSEKLEARLLATPPPSPPASPPPSPSPDHETPSSAVPNAQVCLMDSGSSMHTSVSAGLSDRAATDGASGKWYVSCARDWTGLMYITPERANTYATGKTPLPSLPVLRCAGSLYAGLLMCAKSQLPMTFLESTDPTKVGQFDDTIKGKLSVITTKVGEPILIDGKPYEPEIADMERVYPDFEIPEEMMEHTHPLRVALREALFHLYCLSKIEFKGYPPNMTKHQPELGKPRKTRFAPMKSNAEPHEILIAGGTSWKSAAAVVAGWIQIRLGSGKFANARAAKQPNGSSLYNESYRKMDEALAQLADLCHPTGFHSISRSDEEDGLFRSMARPLLADFAAAHDAALILPASKVLGITMPIAIPSFLHDGDDGTAWRTQPGATRSPLDSLRQCLQSVLRRVGGGSDAEPVVTTDIPSDTPAQATEPSGYGSTINGPSRCLSPPSETEGEATEHGGFPPSRCCRSLVCSGTTSTSFTHESTGQVEQAFTALIKHVRHLHDSRDLTYPLNLNNIQFHFSSYNNAINRSRTSPQELDPLLCTDCGIGEQEQACDNDPPTCLAWTCSRGGPPCYGGSDACRCTDNYKLIQRTSFDLLRLRSTPILLIEPSLTLPSMPLPPSATHNAKFPIAIHFDNVALITLPPSTSRERTLHISRTLPSRAMVIVLSRNRLRLRGGGNDDGPDWAPTGPMLFARTVFLNLDSGSSCHAHPHKADFMNFVQIVGSPSLGVHTIVDANGQRLAVTGIGDLEGTALDQNGTRRAFLLRDVRCVPDLGTKSIISVSQFADADGDIQFGSHPVVTTAPTLTQQSVTFPFLRGEKGAYVWETRISTRRPSSPAAPKANDPLPTIVNNDAQQAASGPVSNSAPSHDEHALQLVSGTVQEFFGNNAPTDEPSTAIVWKPKRLGAASDSSPAPNSLVPLEVDLADVEEFLDRTDVEELLDIPILQDECPSPGGVAHVTRSSPASDDRDLLRLHGLPDNELEKKRLMLLRAQRRGAGTRINLTRKDDDRPSAPPMYFSTELSPSDALVNGTVSSKRAQRNSNQPSRMSGDPTVPIVTPLSHVQLPDDAVACEYRGEVNVRAVPSAPSLTRARLAAGDLRRKLTRLVDDGASRPMLPECSERDDLRLQIVRAREQREASAREGSDIIGAAPIESDLPRDAPTSLADDEEMSLLDEVESWCGFESICHEPPTPPHEPPAPDPRDASTPSPTVPHSKRRRIDLRARYIRNSFSLVASLRTWSESLVACAYDYMIRWHRAEYMRRRAFPCSRELLAPRENAFRDNLSIRDLRSLTCPPVVLDMLNCWMDGKVTPPNRDLIVSSKGLRRASHMLNVFLDLPDVTRSELSHVWWASMVQLAIEIVTQPEAFSRHNSSDESSDDEEVVDVAWAVKDADYFGPG